MDLLPQLLTQVTGGVAASYVDNAKPEWTKHIGSVPITPGAMAAVGIVAALALKVPLPGKAILANLAGGALVYEGVKLGETQVLPRLQSAMPGLLPATKTAGLPYQMGPGSNAYTAYGPGITNYELQMALNSYRRAA